MENRSAADLEEALKAVVCRAAAEWERGSQREGPRAQAGGAAEHARGPPRPSTASAEEGGRLRRAKTNGLAEEAAAPAEHASRIIRQLPETPDDVMSLQRSGPERFAAKLRSGKSWEGDAELLKTLPQGEANWQRFR